MSQNRYFSIAQGVPQVNPLEIDFGLAAQALLTKQKAYDSAAASMQSYIDPVLNVETIFHDDTAYVQQKSREVQDIEQKYLGQDLSDPLIQRKATKELRTIAQDPRLNWIGTNTKKVKEDIALQEKMAREKNDYLPQNIYQWKTNYALANTPGSGGSWNDTIRSQRGLGDYYANVDEYTEKNKVFSQLKDSGSEWFTDKGPIEGLIFKRGFSGITDPKVREAVELTFNQYLNSNPAAQQVLRAYEMSNPGASNEDKLEYLKQDLLQHGLMNVHGKSTIDYPAGLNEGSAEQEMREQPRYDYGAYDVKVPTLSRIKDRLLEPASPYSLAISAGGMVVPKGESLSGKSPEEIEKLLQSRVDNLPAQDKEVFERIWKSKAPDAATWQEKIEAVNNYQEEFDQIPTVGPVISSHIFFGNTTLDRAIPKDKSIIENEMKSRIMSQKIYDMQGKEVPYEDKKKWDLKTLEVAGQLSSEGGMFNHFTRGTPKGDGAAFAEAPQFTITNTKGETKEYVIQHSQDFMNSIPGQVSVVVGRNAANAKEYPTIWQPMKSANNRTLPAEIKYNPESGTYTIKGNLPVLESMKVNLQALAVNDDGSSKTLEQGIQATPEGVEVTAQGLYMLSSIAYATKETTPQQLNQIIQETQNKFK